MGKRGRRPSGRLRFGRTSAEATAGQAAAGGGNWASDTHSAERAQRVERPSEAEGRASACAWGETLEPSFGATGCGVRPNSVPASTARSERSERSGQARAEGPSVRLRLNGHATKLRRTGCEGGEVQGPHPNGQGASEAEGRAAAFASEEHQLKLRRAKLQRGVAIGPPTPTARNERSEWSGQARPKAERPPALGVRRWSQASARQAVEFAPTAFRHRQHVASEASGVGKRGPKARARSEGGEVKGPHPNGQGASEAEGRARSEVGNVKGAPPSGVINGGAGICTRVRKYINAGIYDAYPLLWSRFRRRESAKNRRKPAPVSLVTDVRDHASATSLLK